MKTMLLIKEKYKIEREETLLNFPFFTQRR